MAVVAIFFKPWIVAEVTMWTSAGPNRESLFHQPVDTATI